MGNLCCKSDEAVETNNNNKRTELSNISRESELERESDFISSPITNLSMSSVSSNNSFQEPKTRIPFPSSSSPPPPPPVPESPSSLSTSGMTIKPTKVSPSNIASAVPFSSKQESDSPTQDSGPNSKVPFSSARDSSPESGPNSKIPFSSTRASGPTTEVPFSSTRASGPTTEVPFSSSDFYVDDSINTLPPPPPPAAASIPQSSRPSLPATAPPPIPTFSPNEPPPAIPPAPPSSSSEKRPSINSTSSRRPSSTKRPSIPNNPLPMIPTVEKIKAIQETLSTIESSGNSQEVFKCYFDLAKAYQDLNDNDNTIQNYLKCLDIASQVFEPNDNLIDDINFRLGVTMYKMQNYDEARLYLANVIENENKLGRENQLVLLSYYYLGLLNKEIKNFEEAAELLFLSYSGFKETLPNSTDFLNCAYELADIYSSSDLEQATVYIMEATIGRTELLGESHVDSIHAMELYGRILMSKEDYEQAAMIMRTVTNGYTSLQGPKEVVTLKSKFSLGLCLQFLGQLDEAIVYFEETAQAFEAIYGLNQEFTADSTFKLAIALSATGEMIEAETLFRKCIDIYKVIEGEDSHNSYLCHYYLGLLLFQSENKIEEGRYHLKKGIDALVDVFGKDSEEAIEAYDLLSK